MKKKTIVILTLIFVVLGVAAGAYIYLGNTPEAPESKPNSENSKDDENQDKQKDEKEPEEKDQTTEEAEGDITFLIMGVDDGERTDTIMVCKYFDDTGKIAVLSVPRDTRALIPGYGLDKINHAHVYGGAELSLELSLIHI